MILVTMEPQQPFTITYAPITRTHLRTIEAKYYSLIRTTIEERLSHEPEAPTRNRKPLKRSVFFRRPGNFDSELGIGFGYSTTLTQHDMWSPSSRLGSNAATGS